MGRRANPLRFDHSTRCECRGGPPLSTEAERDRVTAAQAREIASALMAKAQAYLARHPLHASDTQADTLTAGFPDSVEGVPLSDEKSGPRPNQLRRP
jgi:hypothetical protein